jgi:glycerate 2-kinase
MAEALRVPGAAKPVIEPRSFLTGIFHEAVAAVSPQMRLPQHLPSPPKGRTLVLGAGKAAASMAKAVEDHWQGTGEISGLVVTRYQHELPTRFVEVLQSGHPMPDDNGEKAARRMLQMANTLGPDDLLLCLMSGGASALLTCPAEGLNMADLRTVNAALLSQGVPIHEMNCVRKHLSAISGGRLARAAGGAKIVTLLISDVPGDDPAVIGSGPTVADPTTLEDAKEIIRKYGIQVPPAVAAHLEKASSESVKPGDASLERAENILIAKPQDALEAAAAYARKHGITPVILGHRIEGEARDVAKVMAGMAFQVDEHGQPAKAPCVLISGGETTVTIKGKGRGGRNAEFLLALVIAAQGHAKISGVACDTDGIDGSEDNAGAVMLTDTFARAQKQGMKPSDYLANNDAYGFFEKLGDLIVTSPTRTNVNDFRAVLIQE